MTGNQKKNEVALKKLDDIIADLDERDGRILSLLAELRTHEKSARELCRGIRAELLQQSKRNHELSDFYYRFRDEVLDQLEAHIPNGTKPPGKKGTDQ